MSKTFVIGDIHGCHKGLVQCLERSNFDYDNDILIQLGDICDGWSDVYKCVEELVQIRYLVAIRGNHDEPFEQYCQSGIHPWRWQQGGDGTAKSYLREIGKEHMITRNKGEDGWLVALNPGDVPPIHQKFFQEQVNYYIDDKKRLFIHGGFNRHIKLKDQPAYIMYWDRDLWNGALSYEAMDEGIKKKFPYKMKDSFKEIFLGHTTTMCWKKDTPMKAANIWNLDTGAGFDGKVTIMDVDTHDYWQSDSVKELYKNEKGRT